MSAKKWSRRPGAHVTFSPTGELYAAALGIALDRRRPPAERQGANRLMRELADEMRFETGKAGTVKVRPGDAELRALVAEAIDERAHDDITLVHA